MSTVDYEVRDFDAQCFPNVAKLDMASCEVHTV